MPLKWSKLHLRCCVYGNSAVAMGCIWLQLHKGSVKFLDFETFEKIFNLELSVGLILFGVAPAGQGCSSA